MDLRLDASVSEGYTSGSQWARRVTESWASRELYCWGCRSPRLSAHRANTKVEDYVCPNCNRRIQLKAKAGRIGRSVANSAYASKMEAIRANRAPDYAFLGYHRRELQVADLFVVPGPFLTENTVSARKPLSSTARRAGWIGSNIHLDRIPAIAKISIVQDGIAVAPGIVRANFSRLRFVGFLEHRQRGWLADILHCIERFRLPAGGEFHLADLYGFEEELGAIHPKNQNIKPKIRQQVQILRDRGLLASLGQGRYALVSSPSGAW